MQMKCVSLSIIPFLIQIEDWLQIVDFMVHNDLHNDLPNEEDNPVMDNSPPPPSHGFGDESVHFQNIASIINSQAACYCQDS